MNNNAPFSIADIADPARTRVIVGMSGGVDSSVSALLLKQAGFDVAGLFMKNWEEDDGTEYCTAMNDLADAQTVCDKIGIHLYTANFSAEYWDNVFEYFLTEYKAYRTPNPDILCNKEIKFKAFLDYATDPRFGLGADYIATGHYARRSQPFIIKDGNKQKTVANLLRGIDDNKDQSYFLHAVGGDKIAKTLFPIGDIKKPKVRQIAQQYDLITANKKDSTGICFIGERRFKDFLATYIPAQQGDIYTDDGQKIGKHDGLIYYTIGQRGGIGIGGVKGFADEPWFVLDKDVANNRLIVGQGHSHPMLMKKGLTTLDVDWVAGFTFNDGDTLTAKTRYRQPDQPCKLYHSQTGVKVVFDEPQRAITAGQSCVFYQGDVCLGGGIIEMAHP